MAPLLAALERGIVNPTEASTEDGNLFSYALYLLAKWREPRAFPYVVRWLSLPEELPFEIGGDIVTQDGARILAAVCDGDVAPIKALILNRGEETRALHAENPRGQLSDSNPRALSDKTLSRRPCYDHFGASPGRMRGTEKDRSRERVVAVLRRESQ